ncbi:GNAT family N-acetyltransferase [Candidatus Nomurabacteria bacterium]|nr:GNAT family N-acetyltransferase [Candidatus Nomurabacteria bacterium]USN94475.1 MAG: GNAT family N-acetyltransferase [Candidatus Nomurabacteria bacterium]
MEDLFFVKAESNDKDIERFISIEKTAVEEYTYSGITEYSEAKEEIEKSNVFFIYRGDTLVGSCEYIIKDENTAVLGGLIVLAEFRGSGIARAAALFRIDKVKNYKNVYLVTHPHNSKVIILYLSLGFKITEWKNNYWGDGQPRILISRI